MKFNSDKHYLGTLCKRGHDWEGTGKSLRNKRGRECLLCKIITNKKHMQTDSAKKRAAARSRKYYHKNSEKVSKRTKIYNQKESVKKKHNEYVKKYYKKNGKYRKKMQAYQIAYVQRPDVKARKRAYSIQRRLFKEVIAWAKTQPEEEKNCWLKLVEQSINERIKILDLKKELQNG